jgi:hypothetical protein
MKWSFLGGGSAVGEWERKEKRGSSIGACKIRVARVGEGKDGVG